MGSSTPKPTFLTFRIPKTSNPQLQHALANKYKTLRLTGLRLSPEAFSSTLEAESALPDSAWTSRLQNPQLETFICAAVHGDVPAGSEVDVDVDVTDPRLEWVAQATLRGPLSIADFTLPLESGQKPLDPLSEMSEERWQFLALYMLPSYRGQGLAVRVCREAVAWLERERLESAGEVRSVLVRTMIRRENAASLALFRKLGFEDVGFCTLAEALMANGDTVPEEWEVDDVRRHRRSGCVLSMVLGGEW